VIVLSAMGAASMFLVLLVGVPVMLVILVVLERLAQVHLHPVALVPCPTIHHDVVARTVALVEHAKLLGRVASR
jgi:hypothetical protein